jgi:WD40 repeat protein/serine/threonine protein kinase
MMSGPEDASRELLVALHALESGAINQAQLALAARAWAGAPDRTLSEILADLGMLDAQALARLKDQVAHDLEGAAATLTFVGRTPADPPGSAGRTGDDAVTGGFPGERFQVLRPHARGGLGEVFLALDGALNRAVALKELPTHRAHDAGVQARFLFEAQITGRLEHPGIVPVYSLGRHADGRPFYAMRLIEGETLRTAIERFHRGGRSIAPVQARGGDDRELAFRRLLRSVIDVCNAVAYAHSRGVVHRDIKPENIMLGPFGETLVVDWGIAKLLPRPERDLQGHEPVSAPEHFPLPSADASLTQPGARVGTPRYMSPEQAAGDLEAVGPASDIYSLGVVLYCVLVGHDPFPDEDVATVLDRVCRGIYPAPRRLRRSVDPALEAICLKAMALDPRDRHARALDLASALEAWLADVRYRGEQELALSEARGSLTRLYLDRAQHAFGREVHAEGMLWLARALENAPPELDRVIRTSLCGWHLGAKILERSLRHGAAVHAIAFSHDGRRLATAAGDQAARLWDISTGSLLAPPLGHDEPIPAVAFHPDGSSIATACADGSIRRWDAVTGAPAGQLLHHAGPVAVLGFSLDGSRLAAGGPGGFSLWDTRSGLRVPSPDGQEHTLAILAIAFAPDGTTLAVACADGTVRLLNATTGRPLGEPLAHGSAVPVLAFGPGGQWLLTGCRDGHARLWDLPRRLLAVTLPHEGEVRCVAFRPADGSVGDALATAGDDGTARLWDCATGRPIGGPLAHRARVDCLAFRPDGTMIATGSSDGTVRLWCAATSLPIGPPLAHGGTVRTLVFSPDGRRLASGGSDATVRCWTVPNAVEGDPERITCWVRITTDLEFDAGDAIRRLDGATGWDLRRRLGELGGPPLR